MRSSSDPSAELSLAGGLGEALLRRHLREGRGERIAFYAGERAITYAQVAALASRWADALSEAGLTAGQRVLLALEDGPTLVGAFFGALELGGIVVPVSPALPQPDHEVQLAYVKPRVCVAEDELAARLGAYADAQAGEHARSLSLLRASRVPEAALALSSHDDLRGWPVATGREEAVWLMTSGSTGRPRAAVHTHADFLFSAERYARQVLGLTPDDICLGVPKIFFGYGTGMNLIFPMAAGAAAVLYPGRPSAALLCELATRYGATVLALVPRMMARLLEATGQGDTSARRQQLATVRVGVCAGEALPAVLYQRFRATFGFEILDGIGSAEMFHIYLSQRLGQVEPGRIGRLVPGYEARLVKADGSEAGIDEPGRLWVRGGSAASHYADEPVLTVEVFRPGGWVVSGDFLSRNNEGVFTYQGRADDMLKVGGIYVSPVEVENVLLTHALVAECAVTGYTDEAGLQRARAFVVPRETRLVTAPASDAEAFFASLAAHARQSLPGYKVPDKWSLLPSLPRSDRGKLLRRDLPSD